MLVELGPVPSGAARAWINYAHESLARVRNDPRGVPPGVMEAFAAYLDDWERCAIADPTFRWSAEADPEHVAYLVEWLYRLGVRIEDDAEDETARLRPPEADKFHVLLVQSLLRSLERDSPTHRAFVADMQRRWRAARPDAT